MKAVRLNSSTLRRLVLFFVVLLMAAALLFQYVPNSLKRTIIRNPFALHFIHGYHALRKLPDVVFFPYWFTASKLPVYYLAIDEQDIKTLERALPDDPLEGRLAAENRIFVKGLFTDTKGYREEVEVRYRGTNANHWNSAKRSYRINFPGRAPFEDGKEALNLIISQDRGDFIELFNNYRAHKLGLTVPEMKFVRLNINGYDQGVYISFENWSEGWLEKNALPVTGSVFTTNDAHPDFKRTSIFTTRGIDMWDNETANMAETNRDALAALLELVEHADNEAFKKLIPHIVDLEKIYNWSIVNILARSDHQTNFNNSVLYFNTATGKFEPIPWDVGIGTAKDDIYTDPRTLEKRIFSVPQFRAERDQRLQTYIEDEHNLADDLAFYDDLVSSYRGEFLSDNVKLQNNITFLAHSKAQRDLIREHFNNAASVLNAPAASYPGGSKLVTQLSFTGGFARFAETGLSKNEFLARNPEFVSDAGAGIALPAGIHIFRSHIIIPPNLVLRIRPGAQLLLAPGAHFLSYSPVEAVGTTNAPIIIRELEAEKPYGTFLVLDSNGSSRFINVRMRGGSGGMLHGVTSTAMLGFHGNNTAEVRTSSFTHTFNDDAINAKYGSIIIADSIFGDTFSDAIDLDYNNGVVERNIFNTPIGRATDPNLLGDAMDISFSKAILRNNTVHGCTDKGISVGERSEPTLENNSIRNCPIGIAVKDLSRATIAGGTIKQNDIGVSLYRKKEIFGGGYAVLTDVQFDENKEDVVADEYSSFEEQ